MQNVPMKSVLLHVLDCKCCRAMQIQRGNEIVVQSQVAHVELLLTSVWLVQKFVKWLLLGKFLALSRQAGNRQEK